MSKRRAKRSFPVGCYEGLTPEQVRAQVGTAVPKPSFDTTRTPPSMRGMNWSRAALGGNGKLMKPIDGGWTGQ
jgi:hypothetical protein